MFKLIINDDLVLKPINSFCATELYELIDNNRMYLKKWLDWVDRVKCVDDIREFIKIMRDTYAKEKGLQATIWYRGRLVGLTGLHNMNLENHEASIGYWLSEDAQSKGIMTKATAAIVDHAFKELHLHRLEIRCAVGNMGSQRIAEKLGFTFEGVVREIQYHDGEYLSHRVYGLLSREWPK